MTRYIRVEIHVKRDDGSNTDCDVDDVSMKIRFVVPPTATATATPTATATATPTATATATATRTPTALPALAAVTGIIVDAGSRAVLAGAQVCAVGTGRCATSDDFGQYSLSAVAAGNRTLRVSRSGYVTRDIALRLSAGQTATQNIALTPQATATPTRTPTRTPVPAPASIAGTVVRADTGAALAQARVCVVGTSQCATTAANGQYALGGVAAGGRTLRITRSGYVTLNVPLALRAGQRATPRHALVPPLARGELRVVLTWGATPVDLDSYLWVPQSSGTYRVEPGQRGSLVRFPFAVLMREDNDGHGPEHVYVNRLQSGRMTFAVFNWSAYERPNSPPLAGSGAVVEVYDRSGLRGRFVVPASGTGRWWTVFSYVGSSGALTAVNSLGNTRPLP
jgi:hypothetical protein